MKIVYYVVGDTNDGDYITAETEVKNYTPEEQVNIERIAEIVMNFEDKWGHNWASSENNGEELKDFYPELSEYDIDLFSDLLPYGEYGIHTVDEFEIREIKVLKKFERKEYI